MPIKKGKEPLIGFSFMPEPFIIIFFGGAVKSMLPLIHIQN